MVIFFETHFGKFWNHLIPYTSFSTQILMQTLNLELKMKQKQSYKSMTKHTEH